MRHLLSHTSGVSGWEMPFAIEDVYDWEKSTEPPRAPGAVVAAGNGIGLSRGQLRTPDRRGDPARHRQDPQGVRARRDREPARSRRPDRRPRRGRPPHRRGDSAAAVAHPARLAAPRPPGLHDVRGVPARREQRHDRRDRGRGGARTSAVPTATATHRALARALSPISLGGKANGVQLLSPETIDLIFQEQSDGPDLVLFIPLRFGIGFGLPSPGERSRSFPTGRICWWGGWGGSAIVDEPRPSGHVRLRDEQDGAGHDRHRTHQPVREADLRSPRLIPQAPASRSTSRPSARRSCRGDAGISVTPSATPALSMSAINPASPSTVPA